MNKVFNIGLPKTGTSSLHNALVMLGYRSLHNPLDLRFMSYERGIYKYPKDEDWDAITNFGENFYPQLDLFYPDSKFILTHRCKSEWMRSAEQWYSKAPYYPPRDNKSRLETFGCMRFNRERFSYVYDTHYAGVVDYFRDRASDLLILELGEEDPWKKLCPFLDKPIPSLPYPNKNSNAEATLPQNQLIYRLQIWIKYLGR